MFTPLPGRIVPARVLALLALTVAACALPASASAALPACTDTATSSTVVSKASSAPANAVICLSAGSYGTQTFATKRTSLVTLRPADGAAVSIDPKFSSAANYTLTGFSGSSSVSGGDINGSSNHITISANTITAQLSVDTQGIVNGAILIDGNQVNPLDVSGGTDGAIDVAWLGGPGNQNSGVTVSNNDIIGPGCSDGIQISAYGVQVIGNTIHGKRQGSCGVHVDGIQLYGQSHTTLRDNVLYDNDTGIVAYDGGNSEVFENNAIRNIQRTDEALTCSGCAGVIARHNTVESPSFINFGSKPGQQTTNVTVTNNVAGAGIQATNTGAAPTYTARDYNLCNTASNCPGANSIAGTPAFSGGNSYTTLDAATLTSSSPGYHAASDGTSMGVAGSGAPPPPPPPADTTAPDTTITSGPSTPTTSTSASFAFTASESGSTLACKLDAGAYGACTSPKAYSSLATGSHTFSVRATDAAGNVDASPATQTWTITAIPPPPDTTAPDTTITSGPSGPTNDATPSFAFSSTESGSTFTCRADSGAWGACTSPWTTPTLSNGSHSVDVRATDGAGNVDASPATRTFTVDTVAPHTTITSKPDAVSLSSGASVGFAVDDAAAGSQCRLDGGAWSACSSPYALSGLSAGPHQVDVRSTDAVGNVESPVASASWTTVAAVTSPTVPTGSTTSPAPTTPTPTAALASPDPTATTASERAAAPAPDEASAAPTVSLALPGAGTALGGASRFTAVARSGSPIRRVEFWVDARKLASDATAPYSSLVKLSRVASGTHTVTARAFDAVGRAASTAILVKVSHTRRGVRAAAVPGAVTTLTSAAAGAGATHLVGRAPKHRLVRVTLTRCGDATGAIVDRVRVRADKRGRIDSTRGRGGLCVLSLQLAS